MDQIPRELKCVGVGVLLQLNEIRLFWIKLKRKKVCVSNIFGFAKHSFPLKIHGFKAKTFIIHSLKEGFSVSWSKTNNSKFIDRKTVFSD